MFVAQIAQHLDRSRAFLVVYSPSKSDTIAFYAIVKRPPRKAAPIPRF